MSVGLGGYTTQHNTKRRGINLTAVALADNKYFSADNWKMVDSLAVNKHTSVGFFSSTVKDAYLAVLVDTDISKTWIVNVEWLFGVPVPMDVIWEFDEQLSFHDGLNRFLEVAKTAAKAIDDLAASLEAL